MREWAEFPDALLQREALRIRLQRGVPADALVGLRVTDADVEVILGELSGSPRTDDDAIRARIAGLDQRVDEARLAFPSALAADPTMAALVHAALLDDAASEVFTLLCAVDLEPRRQRLLGYVQDDVAASRPRLHTLMRLFGDGHPGIAAVAPWGLLHRAGFVSVGGDSPWGTTEVVLAPGVGWAVAGYAVPDPDLPAGIRIFDAEDPEGVDPLALDDGGAEPGVECVLVWGADLTRRVQEAARRLPRRSFLRTSVPATTKEWDAVVRTATIFQLGVLLTVDDALDDVARDRINRTASVAWGVLSPHALSVDQLPDRRLHEYQAPDPVATSREWKELAGTTKETDHRLTAEQLEHLSRVAGDFDDLGSAVNRLSAGPLEQLARRITPDRTFDDLVANEEILVSLHEIIGRYRHREMVRDSWGVGRHESVGITALFAGASGTGKTVAAEIVAGALGLDMFKIDLSSVVSKWIGETEKNLEKIFTIAETAQQVLLFDEADAIFGKRSEVTDARDRYANMEVAYLLQRLESYDGVVLLTSNYRNNIDEAFTRRLTAIVDFPKPDLAQRVAIWEVALRGAPLGDDVDLEAIAALYEVTGGVIASAAVAASHLAAVEGATVRHDHLLRSLRREYRKLGRLLPDGPTG